MNFKLKTNFNVFIDIKNFKIGLKHKNKQRKLTLF